MYATWQTSPYYILSSGPAFSHGAVSFLPFYKNGTNWLCPGRTNHPGGTQFNPVLDWGTGKVVCAYAFSNDGTTFINVAAITNRLAFNFWDGRVRFLMRKARGGYRVVGGSELAEYDYGDGTNTAVLVQVNIAGNALTTVSIFRNDSDEDGMPDEWELANFTNLTVATTTSDYDLDQMLDWEEYITGTQPTNNRSVFTATVNSALGEPNRLVIRWPSISNRIYAVGKSTNMQSGAGGFRIPTDAGNITATPSENAYTDTVETTDAGYYQIRVME